MKTTIFFSAALFFSFFIATCLANCNCSPYDSACNSRCVIETNHCVTACRDNVECYEACIDDKWPSAAVSAPTYNAALPTSSYYNNNPSPTYSYSGTPVVAVTTTITQAVFPSQSNVRGTPSASQISSGSRSVVSIPLIVTLMSAVIYYYV